MASSVSRWFANLGGESRRWRGVSSCCEEKDASPLGVLFGCISPYLSGADMRMMPMRRLYDPRGPVVFPFAPLEGAELSRGEVRVWSNACERVISQNSSNRRVHRALWASSLEPDNPRPAAMKFVEDGNPRDGRSLKREIECHIYVYQKLPCLYQMEQELRSCQMTRNYNFLNSTEWSVAERIEDAWPSAELFGYHLDKKNPGNSVLLTRKLSGPDLFDVIRAEHNHNWHFHSGSVTTTRCRSAYHRRASPSSGLSLSGGLNMVMGSATSRSPPNNGSNGCSYYPLNYDYHKLRWCALALKRIAQYAALSIRHNDVKPDNIVLDFYQNKSGFDCIDVKLIDLGTASMHNAKDFTGGTSWYESPEQKLLEYFMKKKKKPEAAKRVQIDLASDLWGAGISLAEVLVGRRVVDTLKSPHGPGPLDYIGPTNSTTNSLEQGDGHPSTYPHWALDPADWITCAKKALSLDQQPTSLSQEAAKWLFNHLVRPAPEARTPLHIAMGKVEKFAEEAYLRYRHLSNSFDHAGPGPPPTPSLYISPAQTTSASTPATLLPQNKRSILNTRPHNLNF